MANIHPRLRSSDSPVSIEAVCNTKNVLCGPHGVARVFGPQKGASPEDVERLSDNLEVYAKVIESQIGYNIGLKPGSGASGGLGAALLLLGGELRPRSEAMNTHFGLAELMQQKWDVVLTAEGSLDWQSARGKMTAEIARLASKNGSQVVALAGTIGEGAEICYGSGINAFTSILKGPVSLQDAISDTKQLLEDGADRAMRMILIGMLLSQALMS